MRLSKKEKEVLCVYHARIRSALSEIESCMKRSDNLAGADALKALRAAKLDLEAATASGMSMENRLLEYRNAIESLGFTRKRNIKLFQKVH